MLRHETQDAADCPDEGSWSRRFTNALRLGFSVIPVKPHSKKPAVKWTQYQKERATIAQALEWDRSTYNVGYVTGSVSGVFVLDIDSPAAENEARRRGWVLDDTAIVRTSRGRHYYYKVPATFSVRNKVGLAGVVGVDIRGNRGQILGAGSIHRSGHMYDWEKHPDDVPIAEAPPDLLDALRTRRHDTRSENAEDARLDRRGTGFSVEIEGLIAQLRNAAEGQRNDLLYKTGFLVGQLVSSGRGNREELEAQVRDAARACGLPDEEIDCTLARAIAVGETRPRNDGPRRAPTPGDARIALANMGVTISFDEFAGVNIVDGLPGFGPELDDAALTRTRLLAEEHFGLSFSKDRWHDIVTDDARRNSFHPVRRYLDDLTWDGVPRIDFWLQNYAGAEDNDFVRAVSGISLIAAVRRVREPGCKFDEMVVLEGPQGTGKSTGLAILAGAEEWFTDDLPLNADTKTVMEQTGGRWIVEFSELNGMSRSDADHVKATLSRRVDKARPAYGKLTTTRPRQCVFFGTTNDDKYLRDMTGNRRFWPVKVGRFDLEALRRDRDQLWAEASVREASGESIRLPEALWRSAAAQQSARVLDDPFFETLSERLEGIVGKIRASDIWNMVGLGQHYAGGRTQVQNVRLSGAMKMLGWDRPKSKLRFGGPPQYAWVKGEVGLGGEYPEVPQEVLFPGREEM